MSLAAATTAIVGRSASTKLFDPAAIRVRLFSGPRPTPRQRPPSARTSAPPSRRRTENAVPIARTRTAPASTTKGRELSCATWNQASPSSSFTSRLVASIETATLLLVLIEATEPSARGTRLTSPIAVSSSTGRGRCKHQARHARRADRTQRSTDQEGPADQGLSGVDRRRAGPWVRRSRARDRDRQGPPPRATARRRVAHRPRASRRVCAALPAQRRAVNRIAQRTAASSVSEALSVTIASRFEAGRSGSPSPAMPSG